jgi:hypothetical protein
LLEEAKLYLIGIFNEIMSTGMISESWLRTKVGPMLKPRKDLELSNSYRPCARKLLEQMLMSTRLDYWAEKYEVHGRLASMVFKNAGGRGIVWRYLQRMYISLLKENSRR